MNDGCNYRHAIVNGTRTTTDIGNESGAGAGAGDEMDMRNECGMGNSNMLTLTVSGGHYVPSTHGLVEARSLSVLDELYDGNGNLLRVVDARWVVVRGLYAPVTTSGTIEVDGVLASTYAIRPAVAHALVAPLRIFPFLPLHDVVRDASAVGRWVMRRQQRSVARCMGGGGGITDVQALATAVGKKWGMATVAAAVRGCSGVQTEEKHDARKWRQG